MTAVNTTLRPTIRALSMIPGLRYIAFSALGFQVFHLVEHGAQLAYWMANPTAAPWLTPWAAFGVDALSIAALPGLGGELLHLIGNAIFFAGLMALAGMYAGKNDRALRWALGVQGFHVVEHLLLTASVFLLGRPLGFSTAFGFLLDTGAVGTSTRVWIHFTINLAATVLALMAVRSAARRRAYDPSVIRREP